MKNFLKIAAIVLLLPAVVIAATTDEAKFQARVGKSAPQNPGLAPAVLCVCTDGSPAHNLAGSLASYSASYLAYEAVGVACYVPFFYPGTELSASVYACNSWILLPK
jgi:hypothetical protein